MVQKEDAERFQIVGGGQLVVGDGLSLHLNRIGMPGADARALVGEGGLKRRWRSEGGAAGDGNRGDKQGRNADGQAKWPPLERLCNTGAERVIVTRRRRVWRATSHRC